MKKILLVEDDNNLREIYGARLLAEGYDIVSAKDGEEALSMAVAEKPDLIISDIMMPKISGFDMLDILRATPATKDTKVIMMTALSQAEDRERGERLGADKYLVKSQVTLEDVVKVVEEVLQVGGSTPTPATPAEKPAETPPAEPAAPVAAPTEPAANPAPAPAPPPEPDQPAPVAAPATPPAAPEPPKPAPEEPKSEPVLTPGAVQGATPPMPPKDADDATVEDSTLPGSNSDLESASRKPKVIEPINDLTQQPDLNDLLAKEAAKEQVAPAAPVSIPASVKEETSKDEAAIASMLTAAQSTKDEKAAVTAQIDDAVQDPPKADDENESATPPAS